MEHEHEDYGLEQDKDYILLKERSRVDRQLWLKLTQSLKDMESDYDPGIAIREVNHFMKMRDLNHNIHKNEGTNLGIGLYGNENFTCALHEVRCMVPDAWPMYRESTMEEFLQAEENYRRAYEEL